MAQPLAFQIFHFTGNSTCVSQPREVMWQEVAFSKLPVVYLEKFYHKSAQAMVLFVFFMTV